MPFGRTKACSIFSCSLGEQCTKILPGDLTQQRSPAERALSLEKSVQDLIERVIALPRMDRKRIPQRYRPTLADLIGTIPALVLNGRIPPRGKMDYVVSIGQCEANVSSLGRQHHERELSIGDLPEYTDLPLLSITTDLAGNAAWRAW